MNQLKIYTALRDAQFENQVHALIHANDHEAHQIHLDDIINDVRAYDGLFIVEESYHGILELIEFHNSCKFNLLPVIFVFDPKSPDKEWVNSVRYPYKYFAVEHKLLPLLFTRIVAHMDELRRTKFNEFVLEHHKPVLEPFFNEKLSFRGALGQALAHLLDFLFADKGSIMLLNDKGNLVIEASTKPHLIGLEVVPDPNSPAWSVMETKKPLFVEDISKDQRFKKKSDGYSKDYFLIVPIFLNGEIHGVLNLTDKMVSLFFDRSDLLRARNFLRLLEPMLALHSGIAVDIT